MPAGQVTPQGIAVQQGDTIRLTGWSIRADTYVLALEVVDLNGNELSPILLTQVVTSDRSGKNTDFPVVNGMRIIGAGLSQQSGTLPVGPGETFFNCQIYSGSQSAGRQIVATLFAGYWYPGHTPSYPAGTIESAVDGPGRLYNVAPSNPATNTEMTITVPTGARWRLLGLNLQLVTSSTVNNRTHHLIIDDGTNTIDQGNGETPTQAASLTRNYLYQPGRAVALETAFDAAGFIRLPIINVAAVRAWLRNGGRIRTVSTALSAGDQYSAPQVWVEEWIETN